MNNIKLDPMGFHGDLLLINFLDSLTPYYGDFVETGTHIGSSSLFFAKRNKDKQVYTCEKNPIFFNLAKKNLLGYDNIHLYNQSSPEFLQNLNIEGNVLYYLDSHWEKYWPLEDELRYLTLNKDSGIILIDDAKVPSDSFQYDTYEGRVCDLIFLKSVLNSKHKYKIFYPKYEENTSDFHPLIGYFFIIFGFDWILPYDLVDKFGVEEV